MNIHEAQVFIANETGEEIPKLEILFFHVETNEAGLLLDEKTVKSLVADIKLHQEIKKTRKEDK